MTTFQIRNIAENGGTIAVAPVTVPEAVRFPNNADLNTLIGSIATIQGDTASRNFSAGEYIIRNGVLYKVTTAVSSGATWGSGNTSQTSVGSEISGIKSDLTWKLAGTVTGKTPLSLPTNYNELQVNVTLTSNYQVTQHFIRDELNGGWYLWGASYATSSAPSTPIPVFATAYISQTTFTLYSAQYANNVVSDSAVIKVYYR